jgi:signal transduction histidine kinase
MKTSIRTISLSSKSGKFYYIILKFSYSIIAANLLVANCQITKKVDTFVNKMFKMADGYLTEHNKMSGDKLNRNVINLTFENFRKKKEQAA